MTDVMRARIMRLWLPECDSCEGSGTVHDESKIVGGPCPRCHGLGVTLVDASGDKWPWWQELLFSDKDEHAMFPYIPDFRLARDALILAQRMNSDWTFPMEIEPPFWSDGKGHGWEIRGGNNSSKSDQVQGEGKTLGEALLAALAEGE